jgi:hypothetical protein
MFNDDISVHSPRIFPSMFFCDDYRTTYFRRRPGRERLGTTKQTLLMKLVLVVEQVVQLLVKLVVGLMVVKLFVELVAELIAELVVVELVAEMVVKLAVELEEKEERIAVSTAPSLMFQPM